MKGTVAIIGAGISGLTAAYQLQEAGFKPVIFEKESFVGGRMSSETVDGFVIDKAAYTFPDFYGNLREFVGGLGLDDVLTETSGTSSTFVKGEEYRVKIGDPKDFLKYKLLSVKNKARMMKLFLYAQAQGKALDVANPSEKTFALEAESAAEYIIRNYDEEILEHIVYPLFAEIFLGSPENNSKLALLLTLVNLTRFKIFNIQGGMGSLTERMAKDLDVRLNTPVLTVANSTSEGPYEVHVGGSNPETSEFDALVFAMPLPAVSEVLQDIPRDLRKSFLAVQYAPSMVVVFAVNRENPDTAMINNFLRKDRTTLATVVFDHHKGPNRMPAGKGLVTAILRERASRSMFGLPDETVFHKVLMEMDATFEGFSDAVIFGKIYRWDYGAVQLPPGAVAEKLKLRRELQKRLHNVCMASDSLLGTSLEVSFITGSMAARQIAARLGA